jgi:acyl dehydratase
MDGARVARDPGEASEEGHEAMAEATALSYEVRANNLSRTSENRIHDDEVARRFGFAGALVPGVEVYAYACHPVVACWGRDWLARGAAECRFLKPVYDGAPVRVTAEEAEDGAALALRVESGGTLCATGRAWMPDDPPDTGLTAEDRPWNAPPAERLPASEATLAPGTWLCTAPERITTEALAGYLRDISEADPLYAAEGLVHPGLILRLCNRALTQNVVLGPWIHVGSRVRNLSLARAGETFAVSARVLANAERKGHRLVELDALVTADRRRPVAHALHTAIWRLRAAG